MRALGRAVAVALRGQGRAGRGLAPCRVFGAGQSVGMEPLY